MPALSLTVCSANVKHAAAPWRPLTDVVGWQEADKAAWWETVTGGRFKPAAPAGLAVGITWGDGWREVSAGCVMTHRGRRMVPPNRDEPRGITPNRFVAWVVLERDGQRIAFVNTHYISGVRGRGKWPVKWRREKWVEHHRKVCEVVSHLREEGLPVIVTGDFNQTPQNVDIRGLRAVWSSHKGGIDQIHYSPEFAVTGQQQGDPGRSDHDPLIVRMTIGAPTPPPKPDPEVPVNPSAAEVIRVAQSQIGVHEGRSNGHWNNDQRYSDEVPDFKWSDGQPWCDTFVAWCSWRAGFSPEQWPRSASCDASGAAFRKMDRWSEYPAIGAQVFFGSSRDLNHTGIVTAYDDEWIWTVEGNTNATGSREGDGVYAKQHRRRDARVMGYGYPLFPEGIKSADPRYRSEPKPKLSARERAALRTRRAAKKSKPDAAVIMMAAAQDMLAGKYDPPRQGR